MLLGVGRENFVAVASLKKSLVPISCGSDQEEEEKQDNRSWRDVKRQKKLNRLLILTTSAEEEEVLHVITSRYLS